MIGPPFLSVPSSSPVFLVPFHITNIDFFDASKSHPELVEGMTFAALEPESPLETILRRAQDDFSLVWNSGYSLSSVEPKSQG